MIEYNAPSLDNMVKRGDIDRNIRQIHKNKDYIWREIIGLRKGKNAIDKIINNLMRRHAALCGRIEDLNDERDRI